MIIKMEATRLDGPGAARYVLRPQDSQGRVRARVEVIAGNPLRFELLTASLPFSATYSSIEVSFALTDAPTPDELMGVITDIAALTTKGSSKGRTDHLVVQHISQQGRVDVHILIPRVDLVTGYSHNPTPPGFQAHLDLIQTAWNSEKGWADPRASARRRLYQLPNPPGLSKHTARLRHDWECTWIKEVSHSIMQDVLVGRLQTREDIVRYLQRFGRVEASFVTKLVVHVPYTHPTTQKETLRKVHLCGLLYSAPIDAPSLRPRIESWGSPAPAEKPDPQRAARARRRLMEIIASRAGHEDRNWSQTLTRSTRHPQRLCLPFGPARNLATQAEMQAFRRYMEMAPGIPRSPKDHENVIVAAPTTTLATRLGAPLRAAPAPEISEGINDEAPPYPDALDRPGC